MATPPETTEPKPVTQAIRVLVTESDHRELKIKAVQSGLNLSELGRVFFLEWLAGNPHALALFRKPRK